MNKTDIAALRELAETAKVCGGMFAISGEQALALLDQFEAERQRVKDLETRLRYTEETLIAANDLLTAAEKARGSEIAIKNAMKKEIAELCEKLAKPVDLRPAELDDELLDCDSTIKAVHDAGFTVILPDSQ